MTLEYFDFQHLLLLAAVAGLLAALWSGVGMGDAYRSIGRGFLDGGDQMLESAETPESAIEEARQLIEARSALRVRRGEEPLDVETELSAVAARVYGPGDGGPAGRSAERR